MKRISGFTLMELMVVIGIIAVLGAIFTPNFIQWRNNQILSSGARDILNAIKQTRMQAIRNQSTTIIVFDTSNRSYTAFVNDGAGTEDANNNDVKDGAEEDNHTQDGDEATIVSGELTNGLTMSAAFGTAKWISFDLRGMANSFGNVTLTNSKGESQQIVVQQAGNARIE